MDQSTRVWQSASLFSLAAMLLLAPVRANDIDCLREFKESVTDPLGYLDSWDFSDNSTVGNICNFLGVTCLYSNNSIFSLSLPSAELVGKFPEGLGNCSSLIRLNLSNNNFYGPIATDVCSNTPFLLSLDLSYNIFTSVIPTTLGNCTFLMSLKLNDNYLNGTIPASIFQLRRLTEFNYSNNADLIVP